LAVSFSAHRNRNTRPELFFSDSPVIGMKKATRRPPLTAFHCAG
jgi:hypothetical protein